LNNLITAQWAHNRPAVASGTQTPNDTVDVGSLSQSQNAIDSPAKRKQTMSTKSDRKRRKVEVEQKGWHP